MSSTELNPYPTLYEGWKHNRGFSWKANGENKPEVALLPVNSVIGIEAAEVLNGKSLWRLSYFNGCGSKERSWVWYQRTNLFRRIVTIFDFRDLDHERQLWISGG